MANRHICHHFKILFILEAFRGQGLSSWLLEVIRAHPDVQGLRRWALLTADAHGLYQKAGFTPLQRPERFMEIFVPDTYTQEKKAQEGTILSSHDQ